MRAIITATAIMENDAIGNDVLKELECLNNNGFDVYLYAEKIDERYNSYLLDLAKLNKMVQQRDTILIYHHGTYWPYGEEMINNASCKIYLKYHNITPASFFEEYSSELYNSTLFGREQTERLVRSGKIHRYLPDSTFNGEELLSYGANSAQIFTLPPFHRVEEFAAVEANPKIIDELADGRINVLFVGRIAPNKGCEHLIEVIRIYRELYDDNIRLNLVGGLDERLGDYFDELNNRINAYGLADMIQFRQKVSFKDLKSYYQASDIFLLMSEHEGFCVPILEAQYNKLPIVALNRCAVKETLGENQVLFDELDYAEFAVSINMIVNSSEYINCLVENALDNYGNYLNYILANHFIINISNKSRYLKI